MKTSVKLLLILLVLATLCPLVASCADPGDDVDAEVTTTIAGNNSEVTTDPTLDENGYTRDELNDAELNFGNKKVNILHWNSEKPEFFVEGEDGTKVNDAIWNRNLAIERRLDVELSFTQEKGDSSNQSVFIQKVEASANEWDLITAQSRVAGSLSIRGYYKDLNSIDNSYLDFDKPWWPTTLVETVTIGDALYFVSGDASTNILHFMYTIYFNKDLKETYTDITDDFYELVATSRWTVNKLISLASDRYEDSNPNGQGANFDNSDLDDTYGFCTIDYGVDAFYSGAGLKIVVQDDEKMLKISDDYISDKALNLTDKLGEFLTGPDCVTFLDSGQYRQPFVNGKALFCQERAYLASNYLTEVEYKYGILPTPKYDTKQKDYISIIGNPYTLYGICSAATVSDSRLTVDELTAVIECWGSEAYRKTTPALFEEIMKGRYADKPEDADMWNIIKSTACLDIGRIFSKTEVGYYLAEEPSKAASKGQPWGALSGPIYENASKKLEGIVEKYKALQAE